jgi:hypothetical protein
MTDRGSRKMRKRTSLLTCLMILCFLAVPALGKTTPPEPTRDQARETILFIPESEMKSILGIEKEGIVVPYGEYRRLYEKAEEEILRKQPDQPPPPDAEGPVIVQANYSGALRGEVIQFETRFKIVQTKKGPSLLDFPLKGVGYQGAKLNGKSVQIYQKDGHPRVVIPGRGSHDLDVRFLLSLTFVENKASVSFDIPRALLGQIRITSDLFYDIETRDFLFVSRREIENQAEFLGFVGSEDAISLEISNRRSFGKKTAKISSTEKHHVFVDRNLIQREAAFHLTIRDGQAQSLKIEIGKDDEVYSLAGSGISGWTRTDGGEKDVLHLTFHVPVSEETRFTLKTYRNMEGSQGTFHQEDALIKELFKREGAEFLKPLDKPRVAWAAQVPYRLHSGYGLFNLPYRLVYSLSEIPSGVVCEQFNRVSLQRSRIHFLSENSLERLDPGRTRFAFSIPEGYLIREVAGFINAREIKTFFEHDRGKNRVEVQLTYPAGSKDEVTIIIESERFLEEAPLEAGSTRIVLPFVSPEEAERMEGTLVLAIDPVFFLEDLVMKGYRPSEATDDDSHDQPEKETTLVYDFRTLSPEAWLTLSFRKTDMTSQTVSYIAVDQDLLQATSYILYETGTGSRDSFFFAMPRWADSKINITGASIKEKKKVGFAKLAETADSPSLHSMAESHDLWNVVLQNEVTGRYRLAIEYQKKVRDDGSYADVPLVVPVEVSNDTGYVVVEANQDTEIKTEKTGLNEVEPYEIPEWPSYRPSNRIIESLRYFSRPFTFRIAVLRRDESPVLEALVEREDLTYTLGKDSSAFFEFDYTLRNTNLQFLEVRLPRDHILWSTTLHGQGIKPRRENDNVLLFPLASNKDRFNLRMTGYAPGKTKWAIWKSHEFHSPGLTIPSMESRIRVFFPEDSSLFSASGNFERLHELNYEKPLILLLVDWISSSFRKNMRFYHLFSPLKSRKASRTVDMEPPKEDLFFGEADEGAALREQRKDFGAPDTQDLDSTGESLEDKAPEGPAEPSPVYVEKKGILSMNLDIPKEGKRALTALAVIATVALGLYLISRGTMSLSGFLVTTLVLCTFLPLTVLKPFVFLFNGATLGVLLLAGVLGLRWVLNLAGVKSRVLLVLLIMLLPNLFSGSPDALAEPGPRFPDIEVYVPYEGEVPSEVEDSLEVFVPTEDYFLLKFLAEPPYKEKDTFDYEKEYAITGLAAHGALEGEKVRFEVSLDVFVNHEKWALIQLPFSNVFAEALALDGQPVPVKIDPATTQNALSDGSKRTTYQVPVLGFGHHSIDMVLQVEVEASRGKKTMALAFPESLCTDFSLAMEDRDLLLEFEEPDQGYYIEKTIDGLVARASLAQKSSVRISWFPKRFLKETERPLIYADCRVSMVMAYGEVLVSQRTEARVEKSSLASLAFRIPPGLAIHDVFSDKVQSWSTKEDGQEPVLEVVFKREIAETVDLLIDARMKVRPGQPIPAVFLEPVDAERTRGQLDLYGSEDHRILVENPRGLEISGIEEEASSAFPGFVLQKRYAFLDPAFQADILSLPREKRVYADVSGKYVFSEDLLTATYNIGLEVREGFLTSLGLRIPEGFRVRTLHAEGVSDHYLENNTLVLPFQHGIRGKYGFEVALEQELPELDSPIVEAVELLDTERIRGRLLVRFPKGFDTREATRVHLRPTNIKALPAELRQNDGGPFEAEYAYAFREEPFKATYEVSRRSPSVDVVKVYHGRVEDSLVKVKVLSLFTIKSASLDRFEILAPLSVKDSIEIHGEGIRNILKRAGDKGENTRITVHTVSGVEGSYLMEVSFDKHLGRDGTFEMPHIRFPQAGNRTEFISIETATVYRIETRPPKTLQEVEAGLVPALPAGIELHNVLWAYRAASPGDWTYKLGLSRLEREDLVKATILREDIRTLVIPQGYALHEVKIKTVNRVLQVLPLDFPPDAELWSLNVAGEPVRPSIEETGGSGKTKRLLVPLIKTGTGDRGFDIRIVYLAPIDRLGVWGKTDLAMVKTGDIPVEKTTWSLLVPRGYSYPRFKSNMEEVDVTVIEAEKTLELAREFEYWTNVATTVTGKLRDRAILNRSQVMTDYVRQQALSQQQQMDLDARLMEEQEGNRQALLEDARSQNAAALNEAFNIIESHRSVTGEIEKPEEDPKKQVIQGRKNIKGWQFKTGDFAGQDEVQESVTGFFRSEEEKRRKEKKRKATGKRARLGQKEEVAQMEDRAEAELEAPASAPAPRAREAEKIPAERLESTEVVEDRPRPGRPYTQLGVTEDGDLLPAKKSVLLKGLRSMDIQLPERGTRFSFKKLGGNPTITMSYRKRAILSKLFSLVVLLVVTAGSLRIRKWRLPAESIKAFFKGKSVSARFEGLMKFRLVKAVPTLMMIAAVFLGIPWFVMGLGLNTGLLLRYLSRKRYEKKAIIPVYNYRIFLKYSLSYIILASSFLLVITAFHPVFFMSLAVSTLLNGIYVVVYFFVFLFTKRRAVPEPGEDEDLPMPPSLPPEG